MRYNILKTTSPKMPNLGRGTESLKILLSQASKDMYDPLVPMFFPILGAHMSGAEFQYPDLTWKEQGPTVTFFGRNLQGFQSSRRNGV